MCRRWGRRPGREALRLLLIELCILIEVLLELVVVLESIEGLLQGRRARSSVRTRGKYSDEAKEGWVLGGKYEPVGTGC